MEGKIYAVDEHCNGDDDDDEDDTDDLDDMDEDFLYFTHILLSSNLPWRQQYLSII